MKVLMIEFFYPENTYTQELAEHLAKHVDLTVLCKKGAALPESPARWKNMLYEGGHSKWAAPFLYAKSLFDIAREALSGKYDIVHVQYMKNHAVEVPLFRWLKKRGAVLAHTIHTIVPHEAKESDVQLHQRFYDICDLIVVHNQRVGDQMMADYHVPREKLCIMPHGAYTRDEAGAKAKPDASNAGRKEFLQFGQLRKYKGIDVLLKAVSLIPPETRAKMHVTIAGPQYPKLDNTDYAGMIRSLNIEDTVTLLARHIPVEEHAAMFENTDICVFPYKELYGSGALIMAYTYGKPVIVSDDPVFVEETEQGATGLLFKKDDPVQLAEAIKTALAWSDEEYTKYEQAIAALVHDKLNWEKSAALLASAYQGIVKQ